MFILNPNGKNSSKNFGRVKRKFFSDGDSPLRIASSRARERERGIWAVWPSGLRRRIQAPFRKGEGSNPSTVKNTRRFFLLSLTVSVYVGS